MQPNALEISFIQQAARVLENPGFLMRASSYLGRPIELAAAKLPEPARALIARSVDKALRASLRAAVSTLAKSHDDGAGKQEAHEVTTFKKWAHTAAAMSLGAASGATGAWAMAFELPLTTTVMMRSMAAMAQAAGFSPHDPEVALEILAVFAYGSPRLSGGDGLADASFFAERAAMRLLIKDTAGFVAGKTASQVLSAFDRGVAPKLIELLAIVAKRLNLMVGEKLVAQTVPVLGAAGGAALNGLFSEHYSSVAYYVFGLKRLELLYGTETVRELYEKAMPNTQPPRPTMRAPSATV